MSFRKILVPLDGSPTAEAALTTAMSLARDTRAALLLLSVTAPPTREQPGTRPQRGGQHRRGVPGAGA